MNDKEILKALFEGVVTIVFEKIDTKEIRTMPCTLNNEISNQSLEIKRYASNDTIVCYGLDVKAWRAVKKTTIIEWYKGYPKDD